MTVSVTVALIVTVIYGPVTVIVTVTRARVLQTAWNAMSMRSMRSMRDGFIFCNRSHQHSMNIQLAHACVLLDIRMIFEHPGS